MSRITIGRYIGSLFRVDEPVPMIPYDSFKGLWHSMGKLGKRQIGQIAFFNVYRECYEL